MSTDIFLSEYQSGLSWFIASKKMYLSAKTLSDTASAQPYSRSDERTKYIVLGHYDSSMMCYGFAVELALKGCIIEYHPERVRIKVVSDGKGKVCDARVEQLGVDVGKKGHSLVDLANAVKLFRQGDNSFFPHKNVHEEVKAILEVLTEYSVWAGRYPIPKSLEEMNLDSAGHKLPLREMESWIHFIIESLLSDYGLSLHHGSVIRS